MRRRAKSASASLLAAFAATASRLARRLASLALCKSTASRQAQASRAQARMGDRRRPDTRRACNWGCRIPARHTRIGRA
eukprot:370677-Pleurochrysis_carterae.AAC.1